MDFIDVKIIIREYYKQHEFNDFNEMDQFLKYHKLMKLIQAQKDNINSPIIISNIEFTA